MNFKERPKNSLKIHKFFKKTIDKRKRKRIINNEGQRKSKSKYKRGDEMRITDQIEEFIKELFREDDDYIEIQRNDLAEHFNCVPSQINYVISTRFKPSQGYYVESKRGGGGHITIKKINLSKSKYFMHIIASMDETLTAQEVDIFISNFLSYDMITEEEAKLLKVATSDNVLTISQPDRDKIRAKIFKNMILNLI